MEDMKFAEFIDTIAESTRGYVMDIHLFLLEGGCKCDVKPSKSGYTVSYIRKDTNKTLANFVCRKTGVKIRIYPQNLTKYEGFLNTLPEKMKKYIRKSSLCKRLANPEDCNPKCSMGYDFIMDNEHYQKCRYMAFMPAVTEETTPAIKEFLEKDLAFD